MNRRTFFGFLSALFGGATISRADELNRQMALPQLQMGGQISKTSLPPCDVPPPGWTCSRARGHAGPCAASPVAGSDAEISHIADIVDAYYASATTPNSCQAISIPFATLPLSLFVRHGKQVPELDGSAFTARCGPDCRCDARHAFWAAVAVELGRRHLPPMRRITNQNLRDDCPNHALFRITTPRLVTDVHAASPGKMTALILAGVMDMVKEFASKQASSPDKKFCVIEEPTPYFKQEAIMLEGFCYMGLVDAAYVEPENA